MLETEFDTSTPNRLIWRVVEIAKIVDETPTVKSLVLDVPGWPGHQPGQHVDVRLTAEDGYQAQRSYSIASEPETARLMLTVELIEGGEVSPYLTSDVRPGDKFELRGPIGGYFVWTVAIGGPLFLVAGGSGIAPLMSMLRYRVAAKCTTPALLLYSGIFCHVSSSASQLIRSLAHGRMTLSGLEQPWISRKRSAYRSTEMLPLGFCVNSLLST